MSYPNEPGFQKQSETSEWAASRVNAVEYRQTAKEFLRQRGKHGATADELATHMAEIYKRPISNTTAGARITELKERGQAVKTNLRRSTRYGRLAEVVVLKEFGYDESELPERQNRISEPERSEQGG